MISGSFFKLPKLSVHNLAFVPKHCPARSEHVKLLYEYLDSHRNFLVLTGAGVSTESGIPDYRSEAVGLFARSTTKPIQFQEFLRKPDVRRRYWARNYVGWPRFSSFQPNHNHYILSNMEKSYKVSCVITQNVDNLHTRAGSSNVIELHGTAFKVICLQCRHTIGRHTFQKILEQLNSNVVISPQTIRPDGDTDLSQELVDNFKVPDCPQCGGILKPKIVFFGDSVPKLVINSVDYEIAKCDALLVLGTSLSTYSGLRIIHTISELKKPIGIINIGPTRGDSFADLRINARCGDVLVKYGREMPALLNYA